MQPAIHDLGEAPDQGQSSLALPSPKKERLKYFLISLSIANLCFLYIWTQVANLASEPATRYYETQAPEVGYVWALILDILVLSAVLFVAFLLRHSASFISRWIGTAVIAVFCAYALYDVSKSVTSFLDIFFTYKGQRALKGLLILAAIFALVKFRARALSFVRTTFFIVWPLFLVMAAHSVWAYSTNNLRTAGRGSAAGMLPGNPRSDRVIWVIFDELDNRLLFPARAARLHLVEFDRLRQQSIYAGRVRTPAKETLESIPSMFLGKTVKTAKTDTSKLLVKMGDSSGWIDFASQPNVFRRARAEGFNTAVSGWNHPYCRIMGGDLSACAWDNGGWVDVFVERHLRKLSLLEGAAYLAHWQFRVIPPRRQPPELFAPGAISLYRQNNEAVMRYVSEHGHEMLRNHGLNLVLLHYPVPHPPGITGAHSNYLDNLQVADNTLGQIRRDLEATGDWDRSTILVTGDHSYRAPMWLLFSDLRTPEMEKETGMKQDPHVPFLLKLPGQHEAVTYQRSFNNVLSADLILEILNGKLAKPEDAVRWLDTQANAQEAE